MLNTITSRLHRRHLLWPGILAAHGALLAALMFTHPAQVTAAPSARLSLFDVAAADQAPAPAKPQPPRPLPPAPEPLVELDFETIPVAAPTLVAAATQQTGSATACALDAALARAFAENQLLRAELARIGPEARSVANAIMFWDGGWVEVEERAPADAIALLRRAILEGVSQAPPECLSQEVTGPRFIAVPEERGTTMLVLGSGTWRWDQILNETPPPAETQLAGIGTDTG